MDKRGPPIGKKPARILHTARHAYDRDQPFLGWVFAIARYKLIDHCRRGARGVAVPVDCIDELPAQDASGAIEARLDIERALARLPERTRDLLRAIELDQFSEAEAAQKLGMTNDAARVAVYRAIKTLARHVSSGGTAGSRDPYARPH